MSSSPSPLSDNNWFLPMVEYRGRGRAEFLNPKGSLEGTVVARFDEHGNRQIEMEVDASTIQGDPPLRTGMLLELFSGHRTDAPDAISFSFGGKQNPCTKIEIQTADGVLTSMGTVHYSHEVNLSTNQGALLRFTAGEWRYGRTGTQQAMYWVLPLTNMLAEWTRRYGELANHPLRFSANNTPVVGFEYHDTAAYIEPLIDYAAREDALLAARQQRMVTAVMVGEQPGNHDSFDEIKDWLPLDLLPILGVATGSEVGAPWVELRDATGQLVKRLHVNFGTAPFAKGPAAVRDAIDNGGIGFLLSQALKSPHYGQSVLRVAAKYLIRGGRYNTSLEDQLDQLCRGFEGLCKYYGFDQIDLAGVLSQNDRTNVTTLLNDAWQRLRALATTTSAGGDATAAQNVHRIADKVKNAHQKDRPFGISVAELAAQQFGFNDASLVDQHYQSNPRSDGRESWCGVLSYYRGVVVHESYLGFGGAAYDIDDVWCIRCHLHDLLLRIILKMVDYSGTYQPTVMHMTAREGVDWVQSQSSAQVLGYS